MASMNRVFLMGNLTRDPEVKVTTQGTSVAKIGLAVNEQYKDHQGEIQKKTIFLTIVAWGRTAENCGKFLAKGRPVLVEGKISTRSWEKDGQKHYVTEIIADRITFLGSPQKSEGQTDHQAGDDLPQETPLSEADEGHVPY